MLSLLMLVCLATLPDSTLDRPMYRDSASLHRLMVSRRDTLRTKYRLSWTDSVPDLIIDVPPYGSGMVKAAMYTFDPSTIWIHPLLLADPDSLSSNDQQLRGALLLGQPISQAIMHIIDHELLHAYYIDRSAARRGTRRPDLAKCSNAELVAFVMVMEGVAMLAEIDTVPPTRGDVWPTKFKVSNLGPFFGSTQSHIILYTGGAYLVVPLVRRFGLEPTVDYLIDHPIRIRGSAFRANICTWRAAAVRTLSQSHTK